METKFPIEVGHDNKTGQSCVRAVKPFRAGDLIATFSTAISLDHATRTSVQIAESKHVELLGSPLSYINHGCEPTVHFEVDNGRIIALHNLEIGGEITFFYPSTEWAMASPFACKCGSVRCTQFVAGASGMPTGSLLGRLLAPHIERLLGSHVVAQP